MPAPNQAIVTSQYTHMKGDKNDSDFNRATGKP